MYRVITFTFTFICHPGKTHNHTLPGNQLNHANLGSENLAKHLG